ncbi:MMPL family transporter [Salinisphaera sp. P385]|uniref:MMPL family transporter n=1 Tax=Spectribacter acetivorans TaxID=3075603 RepID=A0ABU3B9L1_9GAMM|nr:MMPL family transporter [Salinisphaera sp. P385]MDT0617671.1 MMPL family transporter [Salinisphaera sp. P385]
MYSLRQRLADWVLRHRKAALVAFALITIGFAAGLPRVQIETVFSDLLPTDDPFVQVFKDHPNFGNPLTMVIMVQRKDATLYHADTLQKVWDLTRDIDLAPAVDHDQVLSITTTKARYAEATPYGIDMQPLMGDAPPVSPKAIADFRNRVDRAPNIRNFLVSEDDSATLIMATFIEHRIDYGETFEYVQGLVENARDANHNVYLTGQPALIGWVYRYEWQMAGIFALTLLALFGALVFYMRNLVGVVTPLITSATAAIWAFGFVGWLNISVEPLLMVVPLLLTARSFSHSVQFTERFHEIHAEVGDRLEAARRTMRVMAAPSVLSILTDVLGIAVVIAAPIPAMVKHAIFCGMWAVWLIPTGVVLISLLLATLPAPRRPAPATGDRTDHTGQSSLVRLLSGIAGLTTGRRAAITAAMVIVGGGAAVFTALQIRIGNPVEGSHLFWHDSEFNTAVRQINDHFPGTNTLEIVLEAKDPKDPSWTAQQLDTVRTMLQLQDYLETSDFPPAATLSFADYLREGNRLYNGGDPRWMPLDERQRAVSAAATAAMLGSSAKAFNHVISFDAQHSTVSLWYPDNKQETVDRALASARAAVEHVGVDHEGFTVRLGTGIIALQEAINRVVERYHHLIVLLLNLFIFLMFSLAYRSAVAGVLLLIPVNLSHFTMVAAMHLLGVGLDVNSMIVAAIGLGVGIDYGIYLLSRICEEFQRLEGEWEAAIRAALVTTGKAILFTATIMAVGILPLYLLSGLKFVADMGLLIMVIMGINMAMSLIVLPLLVNLLRPRFVRRPQPLLGERIDWNQEPVR